MFNKDRVLQEIIAIRKDFGFPQRTPEIKQTIYNGERDTLYIIAEDRADKSNIIGYGKVVAELKKRVGVRYVTVLSHLDRKKRKELLTKSLHALKDDPISERLKKYLENERNLAGEMDPLPTNGKSLVVPCKSLHSFRISKILGFDPTPLTIRLTYPKITSSYESVIIEERIQDCSECKETTRKCALEYAQKNDIPLVLGDFDEEIKYHDGTILVNPTTFFWLNRWKRKNLTEEKDSCMREKSSIFLEKTLWEVYEGLCEPKWGSTSVYTYYKGKS